MLHLHPLALARRLVDLVYLSVSLIFSPTVLSIEFENLVSPSIALFTPIAVDVVANMAVSFALRSSLSSIALFSMPPYRVPMSQSVKEEKFVHVRQTICRATRDSDSTIRFPPLKEESWSKMLVNVSALRHLADPEHYIQHEDLGITADVQEGDALLRYALLWVLRITFPNRTAALHNVCDYDSSSTDWSFPPVADLPFFKLLFFLVNCNVVMTAVMEALVGVRSNPSDDECTSLIFPEYQPERLTPS